jgi:hypothetical protein
MDQLRLSASADVKLPSVVMSLADEPDAGD